MLFLGIILWGLAAEPVPPSACVIETVSRDEVVIDPQRKVLVARDPKKGFQHEACAGVLVGADSILTAAHCADMTTSQLKDPFSLVRCGNTVLQVTGKPNFLNKNRKPGKVQFEHKDDLAIIKSAFKFKATPAEIPKDLAKAKTAIAAGNCSRVGLADDLAFFPRSTNSPIQLTPVAQVNAQFKKALRPQAFSAQPGNLYSMAFDKGVAVGNSGGSLMCGKPRFVVGVMSTTTDNWVDKPRRPLSNISFASLNTAESIRWLHQAVRPAQRASSELDGDSGSEIGVPGLSIETAPAI